MAGIEQRQRVMIVDDDEVSAVVLKFAIEDAFEVRHVPSGETCLTEIGAFKPAVVLLDIEMPGIDGYETCRRLHQLPELASPAEQPAVIFVSGHDSLDERLQAYDSGGDDFITKPPEPAEVLRKVQAMVALVAERKQLQEEKDSVQQMAMGFLTNLGESGTALQFLRSGLACTEPDELARLTIATLREYGLCAHVQLRLPNRYLTFTESGRATPLEESVFAQTRDLDRIFQFHQRMVVNYPHVSILVNNLPTEDEDRCGRLRDHLAIIAEGCEAGVLALIRTAEIETRTQQLQDTAQAVRDAITQLRSQYREQQAETRVILQQLQEGFAKELIHLGLSERQEEQMQALLSNAIDHALQLFQHGLDFDSQLGSLLYSLSTGSE